MLAIDALQISGSIGTAAAGVTVRRAQLCRSTAAPASEFVAPLLSKAPSNTQSRNAAYAGATTISNTSTSQRDLRDIAFTRRKGTHFPRAFR